MPFAQLIEYTTSDPGEVDRIHQRWEQSTQGKRQARRSLLLRHRDEPSRFCEIVFFDSAQRAQENSDLPETDAFAQELRHLVDGDPVFVDLDVVTDREL